MSQWTGALRYYDISFQKSIASKLIHSKKPADLGLKELRLLSSSQSEAIAIRQYRCFYTKNGEPVLAIIILRQ